MSKTYNKVVNGKIRAYIMDCVNLDGYTDTEPEAVADRVRMVYDIFKNEYGWNIRRCGEYNAFSEWVQGLPGSLSIDYYYSDVRKIVCGWLEQDVEQSREKYDDMQVWELFLHLITREFFAMVRKYEKAAA